MLLVLQEYVSETFMTKYAQKSSKPVHHVKTEVAPGENKLLL